MNKEKLKEIEERIEELEIKIRTKLSWWWIIFWIIIISLMVSGG